MDISGVDVDFLSNAEILDLCSGLVDCDSEEIYVLNVDVKNLSSDETSKVYDDILYNMEDKSFINNNLTDEEVLNINYNTVDTQENEIVLLGGQSINVDDLSDDEILALYDDFAGEKIELASYSAVTGCTITKTYKWKYNIQWESIEADCSTGSIETIHCYAKAKNISSYSFYRLETYMTKGYCKVDDDIYTYAKKADLLCNANPSNTETNLSYTTKDTGFDGFCYK